MQSHVRRFCNEIEIRKIYSVDEMRLLTSAECSNEEAEILVRAEIILNEKLNSNPNVQLAGFNIGDIFPTSILPPIPIPGLSKNYCLVKGQEKHNIKAMNYSSALAAALAITNTFLELREGEC